MSAKPATIDEIVYDWISARSLRLSCQRTLAGFGCEYAESGEPETGYPGIDRCYRRLGTDEESDWCDNCRRRTRLYPGLKPLRANERRAFNRLQRAARARQHGAVLMTHPRDRSAPGDTITADDLDNLRHMLGVTERTPRGYRNYFVAGGKDVESMERLRAAGFVVKNDGYRLSADPCYHATPEGARAVGLKGLPR